MGQFVQKLLPAAQVVKTLTLVPSHLMVNPDLKGIPPVQWICGNNDEAKKTATRLLQDIGWKEVYDIGDLSASKLMEGIGLLVTSIFVQISKAKI